MPTVFRDKKGVLLVAFMNPGETTTSEAYCETLKQLTRVIQYSQSGLLTSGVVMMHDNTRPYMAQCTVQLLRPFKRELSDHPLHCMDLVPTDFQLFLHLKTFLALHNFTDSEELKSVVEHWLNTQMAIFYDDGIQKLVPCYKCLNCGGDYLEK